MAASLTSSGFSYSIHSLAWDNIHPSIIESQARVFSYFNLGLQQHFKNVDHAEWLAQLCNDNTNDAVVIFDIDCIPLNREIVESCVEYVCNSSTFCGIAQSSNHINFGSHIYAAPAFLVISLKFLLFVKQICKFSAIFNPTYRSDVAEELSWLADELGIPYIVLYPESWELIPCSRKVPWRLSSFGFYGVGTIFEGGIFHLYQSRLKDNIQLFVSVCSSVLVGLPPATMRYPAAYIKLSRVPSCANMFINHNSKILDDRIASLRDTRMKLILFLFHIVQSFVGRVRYRFNLVLGR